ncbi:GPI transamidase component PIG-S isoform X2 [Aplysia californica]|uniref:GPI transamidase component PIG-S isoform X2 n=1 Tax=Aplysia californica TaxID=6500 RepID=A0ABM1VQ51_APLCA|nr:GPI transamidase component PIG-S isoform X2 [Aplysia californica]
MAVDAVTEPEFGEKRVHHIAALCLGIFCIVVGVPLWWKTTEVYRVSLPYSDIQHLSDTKIEYLTQVEVVWAVNKDVGSVFLSDLAVQLNRQLEKKDQPSLTSRFEVIVREAEKAELAALEKIGAVSDLQQIMPSDALHKYSVIITKTSSLLSQPILALNNNIFLPYNGAAESALAAQITQLLKDVMRESTVVKNLEAARRMKIERPDKSSMRSFRFHPGYDVTFTLMVPEPERVRVDWDIETGIKDYLQPLKASLDEYIDISISSQVLYFIGIGGRPKKGDGFYFFQEQDLPHIINPLESKLGSHASNNPGMNFIVYIPTVNKRPLFIHDNKGVPVPSNSFLSPRWGGVMIYNSESSGVNSSQPDSNVNVDMHKVMEVFISQMRLLLNINAQLMTEELPHLFTQLMTEELSHLFTSLMTDELSHLFTLLMTEKLSHLFTLLLTEKLSHLFTQLMTEELSHLFT